VKIAVLLSGSGRTLENLLPWFKIDLVISSRKDIRGNIIAREAGVPLEIVSGKDKDYNSRIFSLLDKHGIGLVCLAGWLLHLTIPERYNRKILNIHPSLLPKFGGKGMYGHYVHEAVIQAKEKHSGCTVHYVDNLYDHGEIIAQRFVPVMDDDTPESLAARVFVQECQLYPQVVRDLLGGKLAKWQVPIMHRV
jgi:phosphoribosylglycinamide formyltransferase-1